MSITYIQGSLFDAPPNSILLHACNARGVWGGGIAQIFRDRYPGAFTIYHDHCASKTPKELIGTTLLIPVGSTSEESKPGASDEKEKREEEKEEEERRWIACLITSDDFGGRRDSRSSILRATKCGLHDLRRQLTAFSGDIHIAACKFNSGIFAVPWHLTAAVIEEVGVSMDVYVPDEMRHPDEKSD